MPLDTFPMSSTLSRDGKYLLVLNGGYEPAVGECSPRRHDGRNRTSPCRRRMVRSHILIGREEGYVGGGSRSAVFEFSWTDGKLEPARTFTIVPEDKRGPTDFIGDVAVSPDGRMLYAAGLYHNAVHMINLQSGRAIEKFETGRRPYRILATSGRKVLLCFQLGRRFASTITTPTRAEARSRTPGATSDRHRVARSQGRREERGAGRPDRPVVRLGREHQQRVCGRGIGEQRSEDDRVDQCGDDGSSARRDDADCTRHEYRSIQAICRLLGCECNSRSWTSRKSAARCSGSVPRDGIRQPYDRWPMAAL